MTHWAKFIENDSQCRADIEVLKKLDRLFEAEELTGVVSGAGQLAHEIFDRYQDDLKRPDENIAHLYYDSQKVPLREGFRPSLVSERRLKFAGEGGAIELSVVPVFPGRFEVTGRLEGAGAAPAGIELNGRRSRRTEVDEFGFFAFGAVDPGTYRLSFYRGAKKIIIRDLVLR